MAATSEVPTLPGRADDSQELEMGAIECEAEVEMGQHAAQCFIGCHFVGLKSDCMAARMPGT